MEKTKISILGCGWLGIPLAKSLIAKGFEVKGSTTSAEKNSKLESLGIKPYVIELGQEEVIGDIADFLEQSGILIIDIPPKLRTAGSENFVSKIKKLVPHIKQSGVSKLIFVSSTSVFDDRQGEVDEDSEPLPDTDSGKQLFEVEKLLAKVDTFQTAILRFGGLIGEMRHPAKILSGKTNISHPEAPVNLINQKDCIGIIEMIIDKNLFGKTVHGVFPEHPSKADYYIEKCEALNIPIPEFRFAPPVVNKIVNSKVVLENGYEFVCGI